MASSPGAMEIVSLSGGLYIMGCILKALTVWRSLLDTQEQHSKTLGNNNVNIWSPDAGHPGEHGAGHRLGPGHQPHLGDGQEVSQVQAPWSSNGKESWTVPKDAHLQPKHSLGRLSLTWSVSARSSLTWMWCWQGSLLTTGSARSWSHSLTSPATLWVLI